jgi:hypothetical protein
MRDESEGIKKKPCTIDRQAFMLSDSSLIAGVLSLLLCACHGRMFWGTKAARSLKDCVRRFD